MKTAASPASGLQVATVTLLGDSISAGFGLPPAGALPIRLKVQLAAAGWSVTVVGAGVSGDTTSDGLRRLERSVPPETDLCVVALGANDLMQSIPVDRIRHNLEELVGRLKARGTGVLLCGMRAPPWIGAYASAFDAVFPAVARSQNVPLYPFLLEGVALNPRLNLPDRIHPNAAGVEVIAQRLAPYVIRRLDELVTGRARSNAATSALGASGASGRD